MKQPWPQFLPCHHLHIHTCTFLQFVTCDGISTIIFKCVFLQAFRCSEELNRFHKWVLEHLCHLMVPHLCFPCSVWRGICVNCYFFVCLLISSLHQNHHALPVIILIRFRICTLFFEIMLSPEFASVLTVSEKRSQATLLFSHWKSDKLKKFNF